MSIIGEQFLELTDDGNNCRQCDVPVNKESEIWACPCCGNVGHSDRYGKYVPKDPAEVQISN